MRTRQTVPSQWLIVRDAQDEDGIAAAMRFRGDRGVLVIGDVRAAQLRRLRQRRVVVTRERPGEALRVHDLRELRRALIARTPLVLLSPIYPTTSHPEWKPIPRMRAATLARLGKRQLIALGGMDARRYAHIKNLGFAGWAGISAWRSPRA
jgi:thiamine monophosphate synthase